MGTLEELVLSYRVLAAKGVVDAYGHVSMRSADNPGHYFISRSLAPELVTDSDIMELDLDSKPADPADTRPMYLERFIHGEIYKARPDVMAVVHSHSPSVIPFGVTTVPLRPLFNTAAFVGYGIPVFDTRKVQGSGDVLIKTPSLGEAMAKTLSKHPGVLMRGHGSTVVGPSLGETIIRSIYLELSAKLQAQTMQIAGPGGEIVYYDDVEVEEVVSRQSSAQTWKRSWELLLNQGRELLAKSRSSS
ncbi:MAG TPA: class II aldolase/adducin family protein, partial [Stellaceae bacterium]|nr:class II aldolase/adducin family protein [Stellaceae bacterium]